MNNPNEYKYLIDFLVRKRELVDGGETDFTFNVEEVISDENSPIKTKARLLEIIGVLKTDTVLRDYVHEPVIRECIENPENTLTIKGSSIAKFESYKGFVRRNNPNMEISCVTSIHVPPDTKWENISIKFKDGHDVDVILTRDDVVTTNPLNYATMGFQDTRKRMPNKQWKFLVFLSENHGTLSWQDSVANPNCKKRKQKLSNKLQEFFGITEDPFRSYRKERRYEIKMRLIPIGASTEDQITTEPTRREARAIPSTRTREVQQQNDEDELDPEIGEFLSEQAPLVPE